MKAEIEIGKDLAEYIIANELELVAIRYYTRAGDLFITNPYSGVGREYDVRQAPNDDVQYNDPVLIVKRIEPVKRSAFDNAIRHLVQITPSAPKAITYDIGWQIIDIVQKELIPAIDPKQPKQLIPEKK